MAKDKKQTEKQAKRTYAEAFFAKHGLTPQQVEDELSGACCL